MQGQFAPQHASRLTTGAASFIVWRASAHEFAAGDAPLELVEARLDAACSLMPAGRLAGGLAACLPYIGP